MTVAEKSTTEAIRAETRTLADRFKDGMSVDNQTGDTTGVESVYTSERDNRGLTHEGILEVKQFERDVADASTLAAGELGIDALETNKALETVTVEVPMFQDRAAGFKESFKVAVHRSTTGRNFATGEPTTNYGSVRTDHRTTIGTNRGQMSHIREHLRTVAADKLA